jgi:hypothetical protein
VRWRRAPALAVVLGLAAVSVIVGWLVVRPPSRASLFRLVRAVNVPYRYPRDHSPAVAGAAIALEVDPLAKGLSRVRQRTLPSRFFGRRDERRRLQLRLTQAQEDALVEMVASCQRTVWARGVLLSGSTSVDAVSAAALTALNASGVGRAVARGAQQPHESRTVVALHHQGGWLAFVVERGEVRALAMLSAMENFVPGFGSRGFDSVPLESISVENLRLARTLQTVPEPDRAFFALVDPAEPVAGEQAGALNVWCRPPLGQDSR